MQLSLIDQFNLLSLGQIPEKNLSIDDGSRALQSVIDKYFPHERDRWAGFHYGFLQYDAR